MYSWNWWIIMRDAKQFKTLLKKQLREQISGYGSAGKRGRKRSAKTNLIILAAIDVLFSVMIFMALNPVAGSASESGFGWTYFFIVIAAAFFMGILGGAAAAYSAFYKAKDNDLLFALPLKPGMILASRMISVYTLTAFFQLVFLLPGYINWFIYDGFNAATLAAMLLLCVSLPLLSLVVSSVLAFFIALIAAHVKVRSKTTLTTIAGLAFFAVYFAFYYRLSGLMQGLAYGMAQVAKRLEESFAPAVWIGNAALGDVLKLLACIGVIAALFALTYAVMARNFLRLSTANRSGKKAVYTGKTTAGVSFGRALVRKELRHLRSSSAYILNCCLASVMMLAVGVALFIRPDFLSFLSAIYLDADGGDSAAAIGAIFLIGVLASMNNVSAPSVSLEGKAIWLAQTLPVPAKTILRAKLAPHIIVTAPPAVVFALGLSRALYTGPAVMALSAVWAVIYTVYCACADLSIGVKRPMLTWTSEAQAVKQSIAGLLAMLANSGAVLLCGIVTAVGLFTDAWIGVTAAIAVISLLAAVAYRRLMTKGAARFQALI